MQKKSLINSVLIKYKISYLLLKFSYFKTFVNAKIKTINAIC